MPRSVLKADPPPRLRLGVHECTEVGRGIYSLRFDPLPLPWRPGDCLAVYAAQGGDSRPYSMSSSPDADETELLIRRISGGRFSERLCQMKGGDVLEVSPPFGWFHPADTGEGNVFYFATGTGIAPFLSAIRTGRVHPRGVYWGVRHREDAFALDEIPALQIRCSRHPQEGRITDLLPEISLDPEAHYFACGVDRMIEDVARYLTAAKIPPGHIHREIFFTAAASQADGSSS